MIRARFYANVADPRPVEWPLKHPYWVTGEGFDFSVVVAYADNVAEVFRLWPDAVEVDSEEVEAYVFTERFAKPEWFAG